MLRHVYSVASPKKLLHVIATPPTSAEGFERVQILPEEEFIQASWIAMPIGTTFPPHAHVFHEATEKFVVAQESWVVIRGAVRCYLYDLDDSLLESPTLRAGDASFTLLGGHTYEALSDDTVVYEYKTGPYLGPGMDKRRFAPPPGP